MPIGSTATSRTVAQVLEDAIHSSTKTQIQIAEEAGFEKPNVITMIKQGKTKLPLAKVGPVARTLHLDPFDLLCHRIREYQPETWREISPIVSRVFSADERAIIDALRARGQVAAVLAGLKRAGML